jgi:hypothetical protein
MKTEFYFQECDQRFDASSCMLGQSFTSPGYHTRVPTGSWVHQTISSLEYAVLLLRRDDEPSWRRAGDIFRRVMGMQDTNSASPTYGLWPYVLEEPLSAMSPPDRNWADFCGGRVAEALCEHSERLEDELVQLMRDVLGHAAWRIFRDNIRPHYTNIAIMGGVICAAAGELLGDDRLLRYARQRLRRVVDHTRDAGSFNEYNSPAYTTIAVEECERALHLVRDADVRELIEELRQVGWQMIAEHFHPGTQQWAGPHSRAYTDRLSVSGARFLSERTGVPIRVDESMPDGVWTGPLNLTVIPIPCPEKWIGRFSVLATDPLEVQPRFIRRPDGKPPTYGVTWMTSEACLGSISRDNMLYQRRPVLGYWNTTSRAVATLRLRFLHDGRDFSSAYVCNTQRDRRVLSAVSLLTDMGDYSLHLDCPPDGVFHAEDFRLRYHLLSSNARVMRVGPERFELADDPWKAVIHAMPDCAFGSNEVRWEAGSDSSGAFVDAICYQGPRRGFRPADLGQVRLAVGMELLASHEVGTSAAPQIETFNDSLQRPFLRLSWPAVDPEMSVESPLNAGPYLWA